MRIFVAGATGVLGKPILRLLCERGHQVVGLTRYANKASEIEAAGAHPVVADALDRKTLIQAVCDARPNQILHLLTALPAAGAFRSKDLLATNRLRREGTSNLIDAAQAAGVGKIVAESFLLVYGLPSGDGPLGEDSILGRVAPNSPAYDAVEALRSMEDQLNRSGIDTVILRFGALYGRGVPSTEALLAQLRRGFALYPSGSGGRLSYVHIEDAVRATCAATEHANVRGTLNVSDGESVSFQQFLDICATAYRTRRPKPIPKWLVRLATPLPAELMDTHLVLANGQARNRLAWTPKYESIKHGIGDPLLGVVPPDKLQ